MRYVTILGDLEHEPRLGDGWNVVVREAQILVLVNASAVCERGVPGAALTILGSFNNTGVRIGSAAASVRIERLLNYG